MGDFKELKRIEKEIANMTIDNLTVIYNIIKNNGENITRKYDCFLVNLGTISKKSINEILKFINFLEENKKILEKDELEKQEYIKNFNIEH